MFKKQKKQPDRNKPETGRKLHPGEETHTSLPFFGIPRLLPYLQPYKKTMALMLILGILSSAAMGAYPLFNRYALDHFIMGETLQGLPVFILLYLMTLLFQVVIDVLTLFRACRLEILIGRDLKNAAFSHLQTLSFSFFNQNNVGYVHARIMSDTGRIGGVVSWRFMDTVWQVSYMLFVIVVMLLTDPFLAMLILLLLPLTALIVFFAQKKLVVLHRVIREINSRITGNFNEGITGARSIKTLVIEDKMEEDFRKDTARMRVSGISAMRYQVFFISMVIFMGSAALSLVLWKGGQLTMEGAIRIGTLSLFMNYALNIMEPVQILVETVAALTQIQVNIERLTRLLNTSSDVADSAEIIARYGDTFSPKKENWEELHGDVRFEDVSFRYPDGEELVLTHFDLDIPHGTNVAIVGETGAGKSTLVNLVCRFFEPTEGRVLIDGRDVRERSQLWLHQHIGYVLQTPHLFSGSIRDNLRYGKPDATDEEIMEALALVHADEIVTRMADGLDAEVGEGGSQLSTGEKQLLSFARAIIADPRILVLDEATSSIDTVTEKLIQDAITHLMKGRTSFVIAHRLSTIRQADVILLVKDGKIIERGTHKELMKMKGAYYQLYTRQYVEEQMQEMQLS